MKIKELEELSGVPIPPAVKEIMDAKILHDYVCEIDEMDQLKMGMCDALQAYNCADFCIRVNDTVWEKLAINWLPDLAAAIREHSAFKHYVAFENGKITCDTLSWLLGTVPLVDTRSISHLDDDTYEVKLAVETHQLNNMCYDRDVYRNEYTIALQLPEGVSEEVAREAMRLASHKLPIKCKFVVRSAAESEEVSE